MRGDCMVSSLRRFVQTGAYSLLAYRFHRVRVVLLLVLLSGGLSSILGAQLDQRRTSVNLRLRESPALDAPVVTVIPRGARVVVGECDGDWCPVAYSSATGFAARRYLGSLASGDTCISGGSGYTNSRGEWIPSPCYTERRGPPAGASAQCRDGTYSFSRTRRGTCSHHGGVARWL